MNQGKLEVIKQEMARVNVNILGMSELKWTGMGEFNSDDHYIYYCGQESLRRNGVAIMVNKKLHCLVKIVKSLSRVQLFATPWTVAYQAPQSMGFSRQEYWSGLPFLSPLHESEVAQLCPTLHEPMDCRPPGSSVHGVFQARVVEWGAIAFSGQQLC